MAHFVRPLALAESLDSERYEVYFYTPPRFLRYLQNKPFAVGELASMPGEQFLANIAKGVPLFPSGVLRQYVTQERELFARLRPDLVIGDMRLSLPVSARLEGVLHAVIVSAYWSPYARRRSIIPSLPITRLISPRLLDPFYRLTEPLAYAVHVRPINRVRKEYGLPALPADIRAMYTEADHVLYADVPEFVPTANPPKPHHYVGICRWTPPTPKPEWWDRMRADSKPKIFVALGSSGPLQVLPRLLRVLEKMHVSVLLSTSGRPDAGSSGQRVCSRPASLCRGREGVECGGLTWWKFERLPVACSRNSGAGNTQQRRPAAFDSGARRERSGAGSAH